MQDQLAVLPHGVPVLAGICPCLAQSFFAAAQAQVVGPPRLLMLVARRLLQVPGEAAAAGLLLLGRQRRDVDVGQLGREAGVPPEELSQLGRVVQYVEGVGLAFIGPAVVVGLRLGWLGGWLRRLGLDRWVILLVGAETGD